MSAETSNDYGQPFRAVSDVMVVISAFLMITLSQLLTIFFGDPVKNLSTCFYSLVISIAQKHSGEVKKTCQQIADINNTAFSESVTEQYAVLTYSMIRQFRSNSLTLFH